MEKNNSIDYYNEIYAGLNKKGKKSIAHFILKKTYKSILLQKKSPASVLKTSINNVAPFFILKTQKKGRLILQKPLPLFNNKKRISLGVKWIIHSLKRSKQKKVSLLLLQEILLNYKNQGIVKKKQQEIHSLVIKNRSSLL